MPLTIQSKRRGTSIYFGVTLSDSQIVVNWTDLDIKDVFMYSEAQRSYAGRCTYEIDSEDPSKLHVTYPADKQQYLGLHRLVVRVILEGTEATYDAPAINLVASMEQAATPVVSEEVAIGIEITEVDTTILHEILRACQQATDAANAAVAEAEQAIEDAEAATTAANEAAELANEKAAAAQSAATAATNAAALANEKAALANEAAAAAQQAKTAANEAATAALEAKEAADESAENADAKAALAQQAANSANTAATLAENRATEAHEAAAAATVAKNAANTAAAAAQEAATEATSAADEASAKAILASDAAQTATQAATLANTKAGEAGNAAAAANSAASAATTAASSATSAASAATTAAGSATTAAESANAAAELANEAAAAAQAAADTVEAFIANFKHAYLEGQRVGVADNIAPQGEGSEVEFTSRALTDVEENSVAMFPKIMGKSLVWNQLFAKPLPTPYQQRYGSTITIENGVVSVDNTTASTNDAGIQMNNQPYIEGHKYLLKVDCKATAAGSGTLSFRTTIDLRVNLNECVDVYKPFYTIAQQTFTDIWYIYEVNGRSAKFSFKNVEFVDLTQAYGAGNEPTTYAEFLQRKPIVEDEFAYNEGTIVNNKVEKVVSTGINLWDEQWEVGYFYESNGQLFYGGSTSTTCIRSKNFIPVVGGTYITLSTSVGYVNKIAYFDKDKNFIGIKINANNPVSVTIPTNACFIKIHTEAYGNTYKHDVMVVISPTALPYQPYEEHTLDLSWIKEIKDENGVALFEDGMCDAGSVYDEARAKKAVKRMGEYIFTGEEWFNYNESDDRWTTSNASILNGVFPTSQGERANIVCAEFSVVPFATIGSSPIGSIAIVSSDRIYVAFKNNGWTTMEDVRNAIRGVKLIYELATPIVVEYPAQNLCVKQTTGGVMTAEAGTGQNTTPFRAMLVNGLNAFGRLMAIGKTSKLQTTAKTVVGAINELYAMITNAAAQSE